jgi:hypothetical protein
MGLSKSSLSSGDFEKKPSIRAPFSKTKLTLTLMRSCKKPQSKTPVTRSKA